MRIPTTNGFDLGRCYTHIDFYMGTSLVEADEPFRPVYQWIFRRLYERDLDREEKEEEIEDLREKLDRTHGEAVEKAKDQPPPLVVQAYETVFGHLPSG